MQLLMQLGLEACRKKQEQCVHLQMRHSCSNFIKSGLQITFYALLYILQVSCYTQVPCLK